MYLKYDKGCVGDKSSSVFMRMVDLKIIMWKLIYDLNKTNIYRFCFLYGVKWYGSEDIQMYYMFTYLLSKWDGIWE